MSRRSSIAPAAAAAADRDRDRRGSLSPFAAEADRERRPSVFHVTGADRLTQRRESIMVAASLGMGLSSLAGAGRKPSIVTSTEDGALDRHPPDNLGNCSSFMYYALCCPNRHG